MQPAGAANYQYECEGKTMTTASRAPADGPAPEVPGKVFRSGLNPEDFLDHEVSKMNMICRWVHADDGALIMEWTTAEGTAVHRETGGNEAAYAVEMSDHHADALTPVGV
jgi:hypothetical protein